MDYRRLSFGEKVKGFLGAPANTFNNVEAEALGSALKYFTIWLVVYAILRTVVFYTLERRVFQTLWDLLGVGDIKAFAYGNTPLFLFGWIPFVGMLFPLWAWVLNIIGIRQLHEISTGRAIGAVLLGIVALVVIVVLIVLFVVLLVVVLAAG